MGYYFSKIIQCDFETAENRLREALAKEGLGVIMEIDFQEKIKEKLGVDFRKYKVLGACSPSYAYRSIREEDKIGIMLPCNTLVQQLNENECEVAVMDPEGAMVAVTNEEVKCIGGEMRIKLKKVIAAV